MSLRKKGTTYGAKGAKEQKKRVWNCKLGFTSKRKSNKEVVLVPGRQAIERKVIEARMGATAMDCVKSGTLERKSWQRGEGKEG